MLHNFSYTFSSSNQITGKILLLRITSAHSFSLNFKLKIHIKFGGVSCVKQMRNIFEATYA